MIKYVLGGAVGLLVGGVGVWTLRGEAAATTSEERVRPEEGPAPREERADASAHEPTTFAECRQALVRKDVEVRAAQATAARAVAKQLFDEDDVPSRSAPQAGVDVTTSATTRTPEERAQAREQWREAATKVHDALVSELGVTPEEEHTLADSICPSRENQRSLFMEYSEGNLDTPGLFAALRDERAVSTEGIRQTLGAERFAKLDSVGGAGILSRSICRRR